jgi:D-cysteine desulfhydrase
VTPTLLQLYPQLAEQLPWLSLGEWPTPVAPLHRLGQLVGAELWIKRDDLSAEALGGNKVRKLEFLLGSAVSRERASLITIGGIGSNHVVSTGYYGKQAGLPTTAVVVPQPITPLVLKNVKLARALQVKLLPCPNRALVPIYTGLALGRARRPMLIGPGGSSPLGTLGYVSAALELAQQIRQGLLPEPDEIFIALGSGGSMAGLILGCGLAELRCRVVGVRVVERVLANKSLVRALVLRTAALLKRRGVPGLTPRSSSFVVYHDHFGGQYGRPTRAAYEAVRVARETEGIELETTYTAKTMASLLDHCRTRGSGRRVLFWNTFNSRDLSGLIPSGPLAPVPERIRSWLASSKN